MNWSEILTMVIKLFVIPVLGILSAALVNYLKVKVDAVRISTKSETTKKYMNMLEQTVTACVMATNQTYVETLKKAGKFNKEAQAEAFQKTKEAVLSILTGDMEEYLTNIVGDLDIYLNALIESQVKYHKLDYISTGEFITE